MQNSEFHDDVESFLHRFSSLFGEKVKQKINDWKPLLYLIITPGTIINIVHPLIIFVSVSLLPHNFSFWIQIPLYLAFLFLFSKWCRYVSKLKVGMKKDSNNTTVPTLQICKDKDVETTEEKISFFHLKNSGPTKAYGDEANRHSNETDDKEELHKNCKPFITLGEIPKEEVGQTEPVWLNKSIKQFWINLRAAMEDMILNIIWPDVRRKIKDFPANIDLEIYSLCLGMVAPRVESVKVQTDSKSSFGENLIVDINVTFASEASVDLRLETDLNPKVSLRLDSLMLGVKLRIAAVGLMPAFPMVKGIRVCLLDYPEVDWKLGGIGKIADMSWMDKIIKDLITQQISMFVIPNGITVPLNCIELPPPILEKITDTDPNIFHRIIVPEPTGLVKVIIKRAKNLPANDFSSSIMSPKTLFTSPLSFMKKIIPAKRTSDPYVTVSVGSTSFQSKVCFKTLDPEFDFSCEILVECSYGQELKISFWDYDSVSRNDLLGSKEEFLSHIVKSSSDCKDSPDLKWYGIDGVVGGQCLMSTKWIPVKHTKEDIMSGVVAFSVTRIKGDTASMPNIKISLVNDTNDNKKKENVCQTTEEWSSLPAFKESKQFKLGPLGSEETDLFLLRGGMLRFQPNHKYMLIEVHDKLDREEEIGKRIWKHKVALNDLCSLSRSEKPVTFSLEKGYDRKSNCINRSKQLLGYSWKTLTGQKKEATAEILEDEKMEIDLLFTLFNDI